MAITRRAYAALALATAADRVLGRAALGALLMHAFGYRSSARGARVQQDVGCLAH
jgi:hypothetical protein